MLNRTFAGFHGLLIGGNEAVYCRKIHKNQSLDCSKGGAGHDHLSMLFRIFAVYIKLGRSINPLHQYEAWLDDLDKQLRIEGVNVVCNLGSGLIVPLSELKHVDDVARWAALLEECLAKHESYIPHEYLVKRFARLVKENTLLEFNADEIAWEATVGYRRK